ncbi:MAG: CoA pyrophosphatase [Acidobacteria bacterium]|nr:CoA pyrophosphatase [Acidobacteriota bacterium]
MRRLRAEENRLEGVLRARERRTMTPRPGERLAGVLVPLLADADGFDLVIERRAGNLSHHAGQYGFPGGAADPGDPTIVDTALREVREEIGLDPEHVRVLGLLSDIRTPTGYVITPVVGAVDGPVTLTPSPSEVAFLIRVPVSFLLGPEAFTDVTRRSNGLLISTKALVWNGHVIWGATARILQELVRIMRA